jgi:ribosomal protein S6
MILYETLILAVPEITNDETKLLEKQFDAILQKNKCAKVSFERWGKYKLAQQVNKNNYGVYFLTRYEVDQEHMANLLSELSDYLKLKMAHVVMRFMNTALNSKDGLAYSKPMPLDETARDIDKFIKDNKMEGLIATSPRPATKPTADEIKLSEELAELGEEI